jgi:hypothetical protein
LWIGKERRWVGKGCWEVELGKDEIEEMMAVRKDDRDVRGILGQKTQGTASYLVLQITLPAKKMR